MTNTKSSKTYLEKTKKPTARKDLIEWQKSDLDLGVFSKQSLTAKNWYQADNIKIEKIFSEAIESIILGSATPEKAVDVAVSQVNLLMQEQ